MIEATRWNTAYTCYLIAANDDDNNHVLLYNVSKIYRITQYQKEKYALFYFIIAPLFLQVNFNFQQQQQCGNGT